MTQPFTQRLLEGTRVNGTWLVVFPAAGTGCYACDQHEQKSTDELCM